MSPECYFCGEQMVYQNDWNYDDIFGDGEGIVSVWSCPHCNSEAQFSLREDKED